jgi:hypothetical protein
MKTPSLDRRQLFQVSLYCYRDNTRDMLSHKEQNKVLVVTADER